MDEMLKVVAVEEKPIDRAYNAKRKERQTHLEVMGGGVAYAVRSGRIPYIIVEDNNERYDCSGQIDS